MRVTCHRSRVGASIKHNERAFDVSKADNIDRNRIVLNHEFSYNEPIKLLEERYKHQFDELNARAEASRHKERIKTAEQFLQMKKYKPQELILQIGDIASAPDGEFFSDIAEDFCMRAAADFGMVITKCYVHLDEGTPHAHLDYYMEYHDEQGRPCIGDTTRALSERGIIRPDPERPAGQFNNAIMTFCAQLRDSFIETACDYGFIIEREPAERSKSHMDMDIFKANKDLARAQEALGNLSKQIEAMELRGSNIINKLGDIKHDCETIVSELSNEAKFKAEYINAHSDYEHMTNNVRRAYNLGGREMARQFLEGEADSVWHKRKAILEQELSAIYQKAKNHGISL